MSNLWWSPAPHCVTISIVAMCTSASSVAGDQIYFVWDSSKGKSTASDQRLSNKRYYNLVWVLRRSNLDWPPAPHCVTISCVAMCTSAPYTASIKIYFVRDSSKGKSTASIHRFTYKRYYNLLYVLRRSNLCWSPAPHCVTISIVALCTSASSVAVHQLYFVRDSSKGKSTASDHRLSNKRYYNLVWVLRRSNLWWPPAPHWVTISSVALRTSASYAARDQSYFVWRKWKGKSTASDFCPTHKRYYNLL